MFTEAILTNIQNICFLKALNTIFLHSLCLILLPLMLRFRDRQIVILTIFVVVSSVGIKRVVCNNAKDGKGI